MHSGIILLLSSTYSYVFVILLAKLNVITKMLTPTYHILLLQPSHIDHLPF